MEPEILDSKELQNEEHVQHGKDLIALVEFYDADKLKLTSVYVPLKALISKEIEAFMKAMKSAKTVKIEAADFKRDFTVRGLTKEVKSKLFHFDPLVRDAALNVDTLMSKYGNIAKKAYDKETADIDKLVSVLETDHVADMATLGITTWVAQLKADNLAFVDLVSDRNKEYVGETQLVMRDVRNEVDEAYRKFVKRVNSLIDVYGETDYTEFVIAMNVSIKHYNDLVAQRQGRNNAGDDTTPAPGSPE